VFEALSVPPIDPILALGGAVRADARPDKIALGIGVYRDENGHTPIMAVVTEAEGRLLAARTTKPYVGARGDTVFAGRVAELILGRPKSQWMTGIQATGGTGALRILAGLIVRAKGDVTVWLPEPTWLNHSTIFADAGLRTATYPYYDRRISQVRVDEMLAALETIPSGEVTILEDERLAASWRSELETVRFSIVSKRRQLSAAFRATTGTADFDYLEHGAGMFSLLNLSPREIADLRRDRGIYIVEETDGSMSRDYHRAGRRTSCRRSRNSCPNVLEWQLLSPARMRDGQAISGAHVAVHPTNAVGDATKRVEVIEDGAEVLAFHPAGEPFEKAFRPDTIEALGARKAVFA
jgi:aspartate/tyrosine/aromatic aminotransferase